MYNVYRRILYTALLLISNELYIIYYFLTLGNLNKIGSQLGI